MNRPIIILIAILACYGCDINPPKNAEYIAFECTEMPEDRTYFPEESITFTFNMDINASTIEGFKAISATSQLELPVEISASSISIVPPLPADETILISISSELKSIDNKPLQIGGTFSEEKKTLDAEYKTGKKLPEIETFFPNDSKSAAVAVKFESPVNLDIKNIVPKPENIFEIESWYIFVFSKTISNIIIKKAVPLDREIVLEDFKIELPDIDPDSKALTIDLKSTDKTVTATIKDESAVMAKIDDHITVCNKSCSIEITGLKPSTEYDITAKIYATTGIKTETLTITTESPAPHIIISEVMHTPELQLEKNWEFVEIYNYGTMDFDLTDCFVDDKNDETGKDPLILKNAEENLMLKPGELALISGNEADFSSFSSDFLWLTVDDTTIADSGLTGNESVQIICIRDEVMIIEDSVEPSQLKTDRGFSFNKDTSGKTCACEESGGTPGSYYECP